MAADNTADGHVVVTILVVETRLRSCGVIVHVQAYCRVSLRPVSRSYDALASNTVFIDTICTDDDDEEEDDEDADGDIDDPKPCTWATMGCHTLGRTTTVTLADAAVV